MAQFIKKEVTKNDRWQVIGKFHNIGEVKYTGDSFGYFPNEKVLCTGISQETMEDITEFIKEKNELL